MADVYAYLATLAVLVGAVCWVAWGGRKSYEAAGSGRPVGLCPDCGLLRVCGCPR